jgi:hypothetical protein
MKKPQGRKSRDTVRLTTEFSGLCDVPAGPSEPNILSMKILGAKIFLAPADLWSGIQKNKKKMSGEGKI